MLCKVMGVVLAISLATPGDTFARTVLNCQIEQSGYGSTQIMIDEDEKIVIYHFQLSVHVPMNIYLNNKKLILANNESSVFVMTKHDSKFAYAWVTPVPTRDENFFAFSNSLSGTCVISPFQ